MKAFVTDGAGSFKSAELPIPTPTGHQIVVKNSATSLNPVDTKKRGAVPKGSVLGWDSCGVVTAIGDKADRFKVGDRVWFAGDITKPGTDAEYTAVDERIVSLAPKSVTDAEAAALPLVGLTAFEGLMEQLGLSSPASIGKTILVLPGAGGTGTIAIQLAKKMLHMVVITTSSRDESTAYCKQMGADHVINHRNPLKPQLDELGFGNGVDYIFNGYDTYAYMDQYQDIIRPCGGIVSIVECDKPVDMMTMPFFLKRVHFSWELMFQRTLNADTDPDDLLKQGTILKRIAHLVDSGVLVSTKNKDINMSLDGLKEAHKFQDSKAAIGKTVLTW
jgi:NADPH2:quinone reductase